MTQDQTLQLIEKLFDARLDAKINPIVNDIKYIRLKTQSIDNTVNGEDGKQGLVDRVYSNESRITRIEKGAFWAVTAITGIITMFFNFGLGLMQDFLKGVFSGGRGS